MSHTELHLLVAGEKISASNRETIAVINPADESELGLLPVATAFDVDNALESASIAFQSWRRTTPAERSVILRKAADLIRERATSIARLITLEEGIPLSYAEMEVNWSATIIDWCAEECRRSYGRVIPSSVPGTTQTALRVPIGPAVAFTPWNAPALMPARKIVEALAAGCTSIIKPSEEAPAAALEIVQALNDAGLPPGCVNVLFGHPAEITPRLIESPLSRKLSFTGSVAVGRQLAAQAGARGKPLTLELGGHAPVLIFDDVDVDQVAGAVAGFKAWNSGQLCGSPTRILVQEAVYERFLSAYVDASSAVTPANGLNPDSVMGPLANQRRLDAMDAFVADALQGGGKVQCGGKRSNEKGGGFFYPLTVITDVDHSSMIMNQEPFGPVSVVQPFSSADEAIKEANRLDFGLAAYAYTQSLSVARRLTEEVECGQLGINTNAVVTPEVPFGGIKESGYGKEGGSEGLAAYYTTKLVATASE